MEDFTYLLWLAVLVGSAAVSLAAKVKENKRKASAEPVIPSLSADSSERAGTETDRAETAGGSLKTADEMNETVHVKRFSRISQHATNPERGTTDAPEADSAVPDTDRESERTDKSACDESDLVTEIDLPKAVVWSEILKPKFEEE